MDEQQIKLLIRKYNFQLITTHISWVLLGKKIVYKIKKPVDFAFLDYTTLGKRLFFCEKEIELNSRFSKDIYLGISTITRHNGQLEIDGMGEIVDYAVKMKKMKQGCMMDKLIQKNKITNDNIEKLAKIIAKFHKEAKTNDYIKSFGSIETNKTNTNENFEQTANAVNRFITEFQYNTLKQYTQDFYNNTNVFEKRIKEDKIRDCHGDLYSKNICIDNDEVYIYDCIEFNERFRYSDVASDIAFLMMDLENLEKYKLSELFLKYYVEFSQDSSLLSVINFYKIYRAYIRGKIAFFQNNIEEAKRYFDLSFGYLPKNYKPNLIVFVGVAGSGKSHLADKLKNEIEAKILNSDTIRKKLANLDPYAHVESKVNKGIYSKEMSKKVYYELKKNAYELIRNGKNVIIDATYLKETLRNDLRKFMRRLIEPIFVWIDADETTIKKHFKKRANEKTTSDATYDIYKKQKEDFEKPEYALRINPGNPIEKNINAIKKTLNQEGG